MCLPYVMLHSMFLHWVVILQFIVLIVCAASLFCHLLINDRHTVLLYCCQVLGPPKLLLFLTCVLSCWCVLCVCLSVSAGCFCSRARRRVRRVWYASPTSFSLPISSQLSCLHPFPPSSCSMHTCTAGESITVLRYRLDMWPTTDHFLLTI